MDDYTARLKRFWKVHELSFIATFKRYKEVEGFFNEFRTPQNGRIILYPQIRGVYEERTSVSMYCPNAKGLVDGGYYKVTLDYLQGVRHKNNPFSLAITGVELLDSQLVERCLGGDADSEWLLEKFGVRPQISKAEAKRHIEERSEEPYSRYNKIVANLMREIGKGMYSSKQRVVFELLQNADDAPARDKVEFHIDFAGDFMFIMHDGAPFSRDDVDAITSGAESTKRFDKKKTGYKGIGFKSIFTDSDEVWVKSEAYQFAFIRNSELFRDFEKFYFRGAEYIQAPQLIEIHREKYKEDIKAYDSYKDVPWQIIPLWQEELPEEFASSNFGKFGNSVQFALKVGKSKIDGSDGYWEAVEKISQKPEFLLFLRHTTKFRSPKNGITIVKNTENGIVTIETRRRTIRHSFNYLVRRFPGIPISNEAFSEFDVGLSKSRERNELNKEVYYFEDAEGKRIETIPEKLAQSTETELTFGIALRDGRVYPSPDYIKGTEKYSSLFTYLPMEDTRFRLPFLVNADFVPSSDRQKIQGDDLWNKYVVIQIARKHVELIESLANEFLSDVSKFNSYLALLLKALLPEDDTAQGLIDAYNKNYMISLASANVVVNDVGVSQLLEDTIYDNSGFVEMFGGELFYKAVDTRKRLPHPLLESSCLLEYKYLGVETVNLQRVANGLTSELCEEMGGVIAQKELYDDDELIEWLDELVRLIPNLVSEIPFVPYGSAIYSLKTLLLEQNAWLLNERLRPIEHVIQALGFEVIHLKMDGAENLRRHLSEMPGYFNDRDLVYNRIAGCASLGSLSVELKVSLLEFLISNPFMAGVGESKYFGSLALFNDDMGKARPLDHLIAQSANLTMKSLTHFMIDSNEFLALSQTQRRPLIRQADVFSRFMLVPELFEEWALSYRANVDAYVSDLIEVYSWVEDKGSVSASAWASIPWIMMDESGRLEHSHDVLWSRAFADLDEEKFTQLSGILERSGNVYLPQKANGELITSFGLRTADFSAFDWLTIGALEVLEANLLLDWLESDGGFDDFFETYTLVKDGDGQFVIEEHHGLGIFDANETDVMAYIHQSDELSASYQELTVELCADSREKIGLLAGSRLTWSIVESRLFDQKFALFLPPNAPLDKIDKFISNLSGFSLETDRVYDSTTPEHLLLQRILKLSDATENTGDFLRMVDLLRSKIWVNGRHLAEFDVSDRVTFGVKVERIVLSLSSILEEYLGESDLLEMVKESFVDISNKRRLKELIFSTRTLRLEEIYSKIEGESRGYYSVQQVLFQIVDSIHGGKRNWAKSHFDDHLHGQGDIEELDKAYGELINTAFEQNLKSLGDFEFIGFELRNSVFDEAALQSELFPRWLATWLSEGDRKKKLGYLSALGFNDEKSSIVRLRQSLIDDDFDEDAAVRYLEECKSNEQLLLNTIQWLSSFNSSTISRAIAIVRRITEFVDVELADEDEIFMPIVKKPKLDGSRDYEINAVASSSKCYYLPSELSFAKEVYERLEESGDVVFVDESIGGLRELFDVEEVELEDDLDLAKLREGSSLWDAPYYQSWSRRDDFPVYVYQGSGIPMVKSFQGITIKAYVGDAKEELDGAIYFASPMAPVIFAEMEGFLGVENYLDLFKWKEATQNDESLLEKDNFVYSEVVDRLLQDRFGLTVEEQKRESNNAKRKALNFLMDEGFSVDDVSPTGDEYVISGVIEASGEKRDVIVRSARGGLLYLNRGHWNMMSNPSVCLVVIFPGNAQPRLYRDYSELLDEELAKNVLFRMTNGKNPEEISGILNDFGVNPHLILVTSEKMRASLFDQLKPHGEYGQEDDVAIADDDYTP